MVLEVLAAVGLAANVLQFIDFAGKVVNSTKEIRRSTSGLSKGAEDITQITQSLQSLCDKLTPAGTIVQNATEGFTDLVKRCHSCCQELLVVVEQCKAKPGASKWESFAKAFLSVRKATELNELRFRLSEFRQELIIQMQLIQRCERPFPLP
jgi:Rad3-related DNA helicase